MNWCPSCKTVLANEQVQAGRCERCDTPMAQRRMTQWFFRITRYADRLLDFSQVDFSEAVIKRQRAWIDRSEGAEIDFKVLSSGVASTQELDHRVYHPPRHYLWRHVCRVGARAPAGRGAGPGPWAKPRRCATTARRHAAGWSWSASRARQAASSPGSTRPTRPMATPADLGGRLRAGRLWHRRDPERARPRRARPAIRRPISTASSTTASRSTGCPRPGPGAGRGEAHGARRR